MIVIEDTPEPMTRILRSILQKPPFSLRVSASFRSDEKGWLGSPLAPNVRAHEKPSMCVRGPEIPPGCPCTSILRDPLAEVQHTECKFATFEWLYVEMKLIPPSVVGWHFRRSCVMSIPCQWNSRKWVELIRTVFYRYFLLRRGKVLVNSGGNFSFLDYFHLFCRYDWLRREANVGILLVPNFNTF